MHPFGAVEHERDARAHVREVGLVEAGENLVVHERRALVLDHTAAHRIRRAAERAEHHLEQPLLAVLTQVVLGHLDVEAVGLARELGVAAPLGDELVVGVRDRLRRLHRVEQRDQADARAGLP